MMMIGATESIWRYTTNSSDEVVDICNLSNTIVIQDASEADNWLHTSIHIIVFTYLVPFVVTTGLIGNGAFLFMVARLSRMKTIVNFFLVNLAVTDIMFLATTPTVLTYAFFSTPVNYRLPFTTDASCIVWYFIGYLSHYCSVSIITLISVERFYAICHPFKHRKMQSKGHTFKAIVIVYSISIFLTIVTLLKRMKLVEICLQWPDDTKYANLPLVFRFCGPLGGLQELVVTTEILYSIIFFLGAFINGYFYTQIIVALNSRSKVTRSNSTKAILVRNQVARALVINGILFFVTQAPMRINDINEILEALDKPQLLTPTQKATCLSFSVLFLFLNSAMNPYVYAFGSSTYRKGFWDAFGLKCRVNKILQKHENGSIQSLSVISGTETTRI